MSDPIIRAATAADAEPVAQIYAVHVRTGVATFDLAPPEAAFWRDKISEVQGAGWPFLVAASADFLLGFAYASRGDLNLGTDKRSRTPSTCTRPPSDEASDARC
jgi:L-amino acid N-acyltransferase YncA